jgi:predicted enzyme related to lactoylglutathione lyase
MIKSVDFVGIPVTDQDRALAFYTEKLGFTVFTDQAMSEKQRWIELKIGSAPTRVVLFTPPGHESRIGTFQNMTLLCDDVDKTYAELKAAGVEVTPPEKQPWGRFLQLKDPDGNQFVVSAK